MNHTTTIKKNLAIVAMLAAITAALTGTVAIGIQSAAAQSTDLENSGTDSKFKQKEKNNCSGFANCCNTAGQSLGLAVAIPVCPIDLG
jgi:hypothetical protein